MYFAEVILTEENSKGFLQFAILLFIMFTLFAVALTLLFTWIGKVIAKRQANKALQFERFNDSSKPYAFSLAVSLTVILASWLTGQWWGLFLFFLLPFVYLYLGYILSLDD